MKLVSKLIIKTSSINIKELYIGFSQDKILYLIKLYKCDDNIFKGELNFIYEEGYSIYFKIIPIDEDINHRNPYSGFEDPKILEYNTEPFKLGNYLTTYNLEINEKKEHFNKDYDEYFYEYNIKQN